MAEAKTRAPMPENMTEKQFRSYAFDALYQYIDETLKQTRSLILQFLGAIVAYDVDEKTIFSWVSQLYNAQQTLEAIRNDIEDFETRHRLNWCINHLAMCMHVIDLKAMNIWRLSPLDESDENNQ